MVVRTPPLYADRESAVVSTDPRLLRCTTHVYRPPDPSPHGPFTRAETRLLPMEAARLGKRSRAARPVADVLLLIVPGPVEAEEQQDGRDVHGVPVVVGVVQGLGPAEVGSPRDGPIAEASLLE